MKNIYRKIVNKILLPNSRLSYSQAGEDLILANLFYKFNIDYPVYIDIGANHPSYISNTYYYYLRGSSGICIEPNPMLFKKFKKLRPRDVVLNVGIGEEETAESDFYLFPDYANGLSTFSKDEAIYWRDIGMEKIGKIKYDKIIKVSLRSINSILQSLKGKIPDLISIDVEGLDLIILKSLDFDLYQPLTFCVETLGYDENKKEYKKNEIADFLSTKGYHVYADTHINTIFLRN